MDADTAFFEGIKAFLPSGYFYASSTARETKAQGGILSYPGQGEHM